MEKPNWHQVSILSERYLDLIAADRGNLVLLLVQAPIIAFCIMLVWGDSGDSTESLYYVLALAAVWFGTINACRELVKERLIFEREHRVGLQTVAYVLSKVLVLSVLGIMQCFILVFMINQKLDLPGSLFFHFLILCCASIAGTGLGLLISSCVGTTDRAVAAVPILLIPQILFSEMVYDHKHSSDLVLWAENCTVISWAFQGTKELTESQPQAWPVFESCFVMLAMATIFCLVAWWVTRIRVARG